VYTPIGNIGIDEQFFFSRLIDADNDCLEWQGARHRQGYGMAGIFKYDANKRTMEVVHRIAMMLHLGRELGRYDFVYHQCANNLCCNPNHLVLGQPKERKPVMDASRAAGMAPPQGRQKRYYRYTDDEVRWIRASTPTAIAERFGMSKDAAGSVKSVIVKKTYKWVK
jgi:hypothetical protein